MTKNPQLIMTWLNRHSDAKAKKESVMGFKIAKIRQLICNADAKLAGVFQALYDRAIDHGAHPNEQAVSSSLQIKPTSGRINVDVEYMSHGVALDAVLNSTAQVGLCCLHLFQHCYREKFLLLGIRGRLIALAGIL